MLKLSIERKDAIVPPLAWTQNPQGEICRTIQGDIWAYAEVQDDQCWMHLPGLASFRFSHGDNQVAAALTSGAREEVVREEYQRKVLPLALQVRGKEILHSSAVRSASGVTALCGLSETGKSTIAYGLSQRGYQLWADDVVAWEPARGRSHAVSLPFNMRLRPLSAALFDFDKSKSSEPQPTNIETVPLAAVCVLRRTADKGPVVSVRKLSLTDGFAAVLDHSCCFLPQSDERKRRMIHNYLDLAAGVPIYDVAFKAGLENLPAILDAIEEIHAAVPS